MSLRAETDALTGLSNHGAFRATWRSRRKWPPRHRPRGQLGLLMMDLDRFKTYNDRFGHPAGDALLHAVAEALYAATRSDDRVYRYGGDEFTIVLSGGRPGRGPAGGGTRAAAGGGRVARTGAAPVTITVGVALFPHHGAAKDALIAAADAAMYSGKQAGGDRVVVPGASVAPTRRRAAKPPDEDSAILPRRRRSDARRTRTTAA